nr:hypothetical protein [Tanacetum cinerariifolium]
MESSATRDYPSLIHTFFLTHVVGYVFLNPADKALYGLGFNTHSGVPYTEDEIMAIIRKGKQRGQIPCVGRVLPGQGTVIPPLPPCTHSSNVLKVKKREKLLMKKINMFMKSFRSDDKLSHMLTQLESQPEYGGGTGVTGRGMMSREMMRSAARMERMRTIVRRCWRQVTRESTKLLLGIVVNVVVLPYADHNIVYFAHRLTALLRGPHVKTSRQVTQASTTFT